MAALANERIEDAIARGQFKNIPRGKSVERDRRADNPFIDTTEYIMNNMIKRQEIVPPWIEKQQDLVKAASVFRARLRADWKRHAARMIASGGGSLREQMDRADEYARAEEVHNPRRRDVDQIAVPANSTDDPVMAKVREQPPVDRPQPPEPAATTAGTITLTRPFRDADWEAAEAAYLKLAVDNLNALARSYNLVAPSLAQKTLLLPLQGAANLLCRRGTHPGQRHQGPGRRTALFSWLARRHTIRARSARPARR